MTMLSYADFVEMRQKLNVARDEAINGKKSASSNRLRAVRNKLTQLEENRAEFNCEILSRVNALQSLANDVDQILHPPK